MRCLLLAAVAAAVLAGCASSPRKVAVAGYQPPPDCVAHLDEVDPITLQMADTGTGSKHRPRFQEIHETAACVRDGDRARPVLLYSLARLPVPAEIGITIQSSAFAEAAVFAPSVVLLDAGRRPLKRHRIADFERRGGTYTLTVFVNDDTAGGGFMLIEPDAEQVGREMQQRVGVNQSVTVATGFGWLTWVDGNETQRTAIFTDVGRVMVSASPHARTTHKNRNSR